MLQGIRGPAFLAAELVNAGPGPTDQKSPGRRMDDELRASLILFARAADRAEGIAQIIEAVGTTTVNHRAGHRGK